MGTIEFRQVSVDEVVVGERKRRRSDVSQLRDSMAMTGLLHPIAVDQDYRLISGAHRLEAARQLGWETIAATVHDCDSLEAELIEIDENLTQHHLTILEQGEHFDRRNELLRQLGLRADPQTGHQMRESSPATLTGDTLVTTRDIADQAGVSERTLRRRVELVKRLPADVRAMVAATPVANSPKDLAELSWCEPEDMRRVADMIAKGEAKTVSSALRSLHPTGQQHRDPGVREALDRLDDESAERLYIVEATTVITFKRRSRRARHRGEDVLRRETETARFEVESIGTPGQRLEGNAGLVEFVRAHAGRIVNDRELQQAWGDVPEVDVVPVAM